MYRSEKIFEEIGALVKWDGETQTVSARKSSKTITMTIGSADMQIDKGKTDDAGNPIIETVTLDVASQVLDGRTLVPARAISEAFGLNVDWNKDSKTVIITDDEEKDDSWKENTGTINLTDLTYTGEGIEISDNQIKITSGGDITVNSASHAIHCQDEIEIKGGTFSINSTYDKGISAHGNLTIDGKDTVIDITKSTEGIESKNVMTINNGKINIVASDDAINATGGKSGDMMGGGGQRPQNTDRVPQENGENQAGEFARSDRTQRDENIQMQGGNRGNRPNMQMNGEMPTPPENGEMPIPPENENMQPPNFENNAGRPQGGGFGGGEMFGNQKDCLIINGGEIEAIAGDDCLDANGILL